MCNLLPEIHAGLSPRNHIGPHSRRSYCWLTKSPMLQQHHRVARARTSWAKYLVTLQFLCEPHRGQGASTPTPTPTPSQEGALPLRCHSRALVCARSSSRIQPSDHWTSRNHRQVAGLINSVLRSMNIEDTADKNTRRLAIREIHRVANPMRQATWVLRVSLR